MLHNGPCTYLENVGGGEALDQHANMLWRLDPTAATAAAAAADILLERLQGKQRAEFGALVPSGCGRRFLGRLNCYGMVMECLWNGFGMLMELLWNGYEMVMKQL